MAEASLQSDNFSSAREKSERRKVRKGTQSCWECKRRKIKCAFALSGDATCSGCKRRGTLCVSQDYPDVRIPTGTTGPVEYRLARVEVLLEQLVKNAETNGVLTSSKSSSSRQRRDSRGPLSSSVCNSPPPDGGVPLGTFSTSLSSDHEPPDSHSKWDHGIVVRLGIPILSSCILTFAQV
jgi:hypothetical protein